MKLTINPSVCPEDCRVEYSHEEMQQFGSKVLSSVQHMPRAFRVDDIRFKINEMINKKHMPKTFPTQPDFTLKE
jgi:hypothetical protein